MYRVEIFEVSIDEPAKGIIKLDGRDDKTHSFQTLRGIYECSLNKTDKTDMDNKTDNLKILKGIYEYFLNEADMYVLYNNDAGDGYDIKLPGIGNIDAATIAKNFYPKEYEAYCDKVYSSLAEETLLFFNDFSADEVLQAQAQGEGYLYNFPSRNGGLRIYEVD